MCHAEASETSTRTDGNRDIARIEHDSIVAIAASA